ncbi:zinc finger MYM-type protein 1-like [Bacillus rossius redtenbacheri]|uniref:zinc finger MYM-type protein 1-like n=1 Tax=Bacillus rossius redtenbacheri TaxID=93214 RepID=UPI002FDC94FA
MISEIKNEIKEATFVAILLDETCDVTNFSQLSKVLRYVYKGEVYERFVGFHDVSGDRSAEALAKLAIDTLEVFQCKDKLVVQTYDGAAVMAGHLNGVQAKVREVIPHAVFVHCYAHKLNLVLSQAVSCISACRVFFANLSGFVSFLVHSSKRTNLLDTIVQKRFPKLAPTRWSYSSRLVQTVADHKVELEELYEHILENPEDWNTTAINEARGFLMMLRDFQFNFLLCVFGELFSLTDVTFNIVQSKYLDITFCSKEVEALKDKLNTKRNCGFDKIWLKTETVSDCEPARKKRKGNCSEATVKDDFRRMYLEILDTVIMQLNIRFQSLHDLKFIEMFDSKKISTFSDVFPEEAFQKLRTLYGKFFDIVRLKSELSAMFTSKQV